MIIKTTNYDDFRFVANNVVSGTFCFYDNSPNVFIAYAIKDAIQLELKLASKPATWDADLGTLHQLTQPLELID